MTVKVIRKIFKKLKHRTINYRSHKHFSNEAYRESLLYELSKEVFVNNAPRKRKHARGNQMSFITKDLSKAIMKR